MFGTIRRNETTNQLEAYTISGPTDGSTDIVCHNCDMNYQVPTVVDNQFGAGYVGASIYGKMLFNPQQGVLTVNCVDGIATKVDICNNGNCNANQTVLVQGLDDVNGVPNKSIENSAIIYNSRCYICNDETTGDPVYKPVTYIPTICTDEIIGVPSGIAIGETDCNCYYPLTFMNDGELDTSCGCSLDYNPNTGNIATTSIQVECITSDASALDKSHIRIGSNVVNTIARNSSGVSNNIVELSSTGYSVQIGNAYRPITTIQDCICLSGGNSSFKLEGCTANLAANSITLRDCTGALVLKTCNLPTTDNTTDASYLYALTGVNTNGQIKKLEGIYYDPVSCTLEGLQTNDAIEYLPNGTFVCCITGCCQFTDFENKLYTSNEFNTYSATELPSQKHIIMGWNDGTNCGYYDTGIMICTCNNGCAITLTKPVTFTSAPSYRCDWSPIDGSYSYWNTCGFGCYDGGSGISTCICYNNSYICLNANEINLNTNNSGNCFNLSQMGNSTLNAANSMCMCLGNALEILACSNTCYSFGLKPRVSYDNGLNWKELATVPTYGSGSTTFTSLIGSMTANQTCFGDWTLSTSLTFTDAIGLSYTLNRLIGNFYPYSSSAGFFVGMGYDTTTSKMRQVSISYVSSTVTSSATVVTPAKGTLYGTASSSLINVCGAL